MKNISELAYINLLDIWKLETEFFSTRIFRNNITT